MAKRKSIHNKSFYVISGITVLLLISSLLLFYYSHFSAHNAYLGVTAFHILAGLAVLVVLSYYIVLHLRIKQTVQHKKEAITGIITLTVVCVCLLSGMSLVFFDIDQNQRWLRVVHPVSALLSLCSFYWHNSFRSTFYKLSKRIKGNMLKHPFYASFGLGLLLMIFFSFPFLSTADQKQTSTLKEGMIAPGEAVIKSHDWLDSAMLAGPQTCGTTGCHPDIYEQWNESMHHFSSFNNPYYSKSIEVLRNSSNPAAVRWCASCHDPLPLLTGKMQGNLEDFDPKHPASQAGITCLSCHAVQEQPHSKGNGRYAIEEVAAFNKPGSLMDTLLHQELLKANPGPHIKSMINPMMSTSAFCLSCHKVSIPPAVNQYRWKRGQNQFDSWQRSGVSGNNIRAFYFPDRTKNCISCHMPEVPSTDKGNRNGKVKSHRFAAANTAVPFLNQHQNQLAAVESYLKDNIVELDIVRMTVNDDTLSPEAPLPPLAAHDRVDMTVVINNRKAGHRLPAGTNDTNEWWVQATAENEKGEVVLVSGQLDGLGRVDSTAHFFRTLLIDRSGHIIDKRNVNDAYATVYNNTINPGTARLVRFRFSVPAGANIHAIEVLLKQRKFNWYYDNFTFRGKLEDTLSSQETREIKRWIIANAQKPEIPITTIATTTRKQTVHYTTLSPLWKRWNDYGIGLLMEGDSKGAYQAFERVKDLNKDRPDGIVNMARVLVSEGAVFEAIELLENGLVLFPENKRMFFFMGKALEATGDYEQAVHHWTRIYSDECKDFGLLLDIAKSYYLLRKYDESNDYIARALQVDAEDFRAIYQQMLNYQAQGNEKLALVWKKKYEYYKNNEKEEFAIADFLQENPQINLENQDIHYHELKPMPKESTHKEANI